MTKPHQGIFFQDATNWDAGGVSVANADPALCPVQDLGASNLCVGVFRTAPDQDDYSLLIVNLDLTPKSSTITLRHSYSISKAPSVVGYAGGNTYASAGSGTTFSIQLAGGEGRMYRVSGPRDDLMAVTAPAASEAWLAGEQKLVSWQGGGGPVTVSVYPDAANFDLGDPPAVAAILGIDLTGNSATLTMPAGLYSRRAQLVLTSTAPDGTPQVVTSGAPFNTVPSATTSWSVWTLDRALGVSRSALSLGPDGSPSVATISFDYGGGLISHAAISHFDGNTWSKTTMLWGSIVYPASPLSLAMAVDALARPHIAYVSQKEGGVTGQLQHSNPGNLPGVWYDWKVADLGDIRGGCAMAAIPGTTGSIVLAYNDGNQPVSHLKLMRGETNVIGAITWTNLPTPNVYQPTSIAVAADAAGAIWLACVTEDVPPSSLRVFRITSTGVEQKLAYLGGYERLVDLALDSSGRPRIAFTNQNSAYDPDFVFYRSYNGSSWDPLKVVDTRPKMVSSLAIAMPLDSPRIAYSTGGVLKLASLVGSTWQFEPIGDSEAEGPVSMKCAANGDLWVSFRDVALDQLVVYGPGNPQGTQRSQGARGTVISPAISVVARNPMVPGGAIALAVQAARPSRLEMALYDLAGRRVADFGSHQVAAGSQRVQWQPNGIRAGVYFLRVRMEGVPELHNRLVFIR
jgi:hypothetical protein